MPVSNPRRNGLNAASRPLSAKAVQGFKSQKERFELKINGNIYKFLSKVSNPRRNGLNPSPSSKLRRRTRVSNPRRNGLNMPAKDIAPEPLEPVSNPRRNGLNALLVAIHLDLQEGFQIPEGTV